MRVLLDECLPKDFAREIPGHAVKTVPQAGSASIKNGKLLRLIADSGKFEAFLTVDKNLPRQQKIQGLSLCRSGIARQIESLGRRGSLRA